MIKDLYSFLLKKLRNALKIPALEEEILNCKEQLKELNRVVRLSTVAVPPLIHPEHCNIISTLSEQFIAQAEKSSTDAKEHLAQTPAQSGNRMKSTTVTVIDYEPEIWQKRLFTDTANAPVIEGILIENTKWFNLIESLSTTDYIIIPSPFVVDLLSLNANCFARLSQKARIAVILATQHSDTDGFNSIEISADGDRKLRKALHNNGFFKVSLLNPPASLQKDSRHCVTNGFSFPEEPSEKSYSKGNSATIPVPAQTSTPLVYGAKRL